MVLISSPANLPIAKATIGANAEGESISWEWGSPLPAQKSTALCRCGHSGHKPYCDGTHGKVGFDGTATASRKPYREQAKLIEGPVLSLTDAEGLCAFARFCDPNGQVWSLDRPDEGAGGFRAPDLRLPLGAARRLGQ